MLADMDPHQETARTWNKLAALYQEKFMDLDIYNESYDFFCAGISKKGAKILDVGCGPGNISRYLLRQRPDFHVLGIDTAPNMIELARKNVPQANFEVMNAQDMPRLNQMFDGIVAGFCVPYLALAECAQFITDCSSLLQSDGLLYLSFVEGDSTDSGFKTGSTGDRVYFHFHELQWMMLELKKQNLKIVNIMKVNYGKDESKPDVHTIVIAQK